MLFVLVPKLQLSSLYTSIQVTVILAGKRVSSARDGNFKYVHVAWIPAIHAGMTSFLTFVYNDESSSLGTRRTVKNEWF